MVETLRFSDMSADHVSNETWIVRATHAPSETPDTFDAGICILPRNPLRPPLQGADVSIHSAAGFDVMKTETTNALGQAWFRALAPGVYHARMAFSSGLPGRTEYGKPPVTDENSPPWAVFNLIADEKHLFAARSDLPLEWLKISGLPPGFTGKARESKRQPGEATLLDLACPVHRPGESAPPDVSAKWPNGASERHTFVESYSDWTVRIEIPIPWPEAVKLIREGKVALVQHQQ